MGKFVCTDEHCQIISIGSDSLFFFDDAESAGCISNRIYQQVTSGKEALELLVKSYRIREDLITDIEYPDFFKSKLVVRKFVPVDISMEFRAFVSQGKITALSQYESGLYFRKLAAKKDTIQNEILALFEKIKDKIKLKSYVIDLAIVDDKGKVHPRG